MFPSPLDCLSQTEAGYLRLDQPNEALVKSRSFVFHRKFNCKVRFQLDIHHQH